MILTVEQRAAGLKAIDEAKDSYLNDLHKERALIDAAELFRADGITAWEEVERLKEENEHFRIHQEVQQSWSLHMIEIQILMGEENERLQAQLQDALKVMQEAIDDIDCEYPQTAVIALEKAIQRIQEASNDQMPS
ncbi:hypothetical protein ABEV00_21980 [Paenibacillus thiaminolyticus]|uniref:hypothetical protein n=1 Tax=Paenibacillus thiaminolyticus TaxID=49283 RepID=UPI003D2E438A